MDWQPIAALGAVALALVYVGRVALRAWGGQGAGCSGCKCSGAASSARKGAALIPPDQLTLRSRGP